MDRKARAMLVVLGVLLVGGIAYGIFRNGEPHRPVSTVTATAKISLPSAPTPRDNTSVPPASCDGCFRGADGQERCLITTSGVRCDLYPPHSDLQVANCPEPADRGASVTLDADGPKPGCSGDALVPQNSPIISESRFVGDYVCRPWGQGVECLNGNGAGFRVSGSTYEKVG